MIFQYELEQAAHSLKSAPNINAALKSFLKQEIQKGDPAVRFVKALKATLQSKAPEALSDFLTKNLKKYERHVFVIARYAHNETIEPLLGEIINEYAEDFNTSYSTANDSVLTVSDREKFEKIVKAVEEKTDTHLKSSELEENGFHKNTVFYSLFEPLVTEELKTIFV